MVEEREKMGVEAASRGAKSRAVYPLHYKRFTRRTTGGALTTAKPETPIYRSIPNDEPLHAPRPERTIPELRTPGDWSFSTRPDETKSSYFGETPFITPASFLHGTRTNCVRHGRIPPPAEVAPTTKDLARSRSGAWIPTGILQPRQVEATSPWVGPTKRAADVVKEDVCPDCGNELRIKRREVMQGSEATVRRPVEVSRSVSQRTVAAAGEKYDDAEELVVSKDLGDDLEAVIVAHKGDLQRVLLNARHGKATTETMQRLSNELAQVSGSMLKAGPKASALTKEEHSLILSSQRAHKPSVPELLNMIDAAANELHPQSQTGKGRQAEMYTSRRPDYADINRNSLLGNSDYDAVMGHDKIQKQGLVERQGIDDHYRALHERLADASRRNSVQKSSAASRPGLPVPQARYAATPPPAKITKTEPPKILKTKPTLLPHMDVSPTQTPPPEHPSLHHAAELPQTPQPHSTESQQPSSYHNALSFLNPFHRQAVATPTTHVLSAPFTKPVAPTPGPSPSPPTPASVGRVRPANESPDSTTPQPISSSANPYHHAPLAPTDLGHAASTSRAAPAAQEKQIVRNAMRMNSMEQGRKERERVVQEASRAEREERRRRSLAVSPSGGQGRKGWFG